MDNSREINRFYFLCKRRSVQLILFFLFTTAGSYFLLTSDAAGIGRLNQITDGAGVLDARFSYSEAQALEYFEQLGESGRNYLLRGVIPLDFLFLVSYTMLLVVFLVSVSLSFRQNGRYPHKIRYLVAVPIAAGLADFLENINQAVILAEYPNYSPELVTLLPVITPAKFVLIATALLLLVLEIIFALIRSRK